MKFKNVLLASDFDGTLKNDNGEITKDVIEAIHYFRDNGGLFTVCTGRIFQGFHLYSSDYINAPVLLGNGAMGYDYENGRILFNDGIEDEGIIPLNSVLKHFPGTPIELYSFDKVCAINLSESSDRHFTNQGIEYEITEKIENFPRPWTKVMINAEENSLAIQKLLDDYNELNYLKTTGSYIEVLKKGVDKGTGLLKLGKILGCQTKDIYAAGDGYNDVEMLVAAAGGFVPENGSEEALKNAKYVTRSNNNGCIAHAIEILDKIY